MKKKILLFCLSTFVGLNSIFAQSDIDNLLKGSLTDANYLVKGYVTPAFNTLGAGLNQGWYNTAKPHKTLGFDLTMMVSGVSFPSSDLTYKVDNAQMTSLRNYPYPGGPTTIDAPTIFGSDVAPQYQPVTTTNGVTVPTGNPITSAPGTNLGKDFSFVPVPMVQLGIGLPKNTDLKLRYFPSTKIGSGGEASMFGFAILHDVKQYIPGVKALPFDLSFLFGYTNLKVHTNLDTQNPDRQADFKTTATTVQGLISKKFSVLTLYGGLGYNFVSSDLNVLGNYTFTSNGTNTNVKDPINISNSQSGPRFTAGLRLKFAIFTLHGDYTFQNYSAFTAGFGFSVR